MAEQDELCGLTALGTAEHYDAVTDAWCGILGQNLHYGYFDPPEIDLDSATDRLTDRMVELVAAFEPGPGFTPAPKPAVLDVGCGVGRPAIRLSREHNWIVTGISVSRRGIELARAAAHASLPARASSTSEDARLPRFEVRDALATGFPGESFDLIWVLESSHLIRDKTGLFSEMYRVAKQGGRLVLGDLMLGREVPLTEVYRRRCEFTLLDAVFGKARMETLNTYRSALAEQGFREVHSVDVSPWCKPTPLHWAQRLDARKGDFLLHLSEADWRSFREACTLIDRLFGEGLLTYQLLTAKKS